MVVTLGRRVSGKYKLMYSGTLEAAPLSLLGESVPKRLYQIDIQTRGIPNPNLVADTLRRELWNKFGANVVWVEVGNDMIRIQLIGSPFIWAALLLFLPQILSALGVIVALIALYLLVTGIPIWVWGLGAIAIVLLLFGPSIAKMVTPPKER